MNATPAALLRRARPDEAGAITRLVLRSKRQWRYTEEFITVMTPLMTFEPADMEQAADQVEVLEAEGTLLGVIRLRRRTELAFLEDLWLEPQATGQGLGRVLFERAADIARGWGKGVMEFEADPYSEPFYLHLGAERVAMSPSRALPGRAIPLMRYAL